MVVIAIAAIYVTVHLLFIIGRRLLPAKMDTVFLCFLIWSLIGLIGGFTTVSPLTLFGKLWTLLQLICLSYFLYSLAIEMRTIKWLEWSYLLGVVISILWTLVSTGGHFSTERLEGTQGNANALAAALLVDYVISLDLYRQHRSRIMKACLVCNMGFLLPFLLASGSRKGVLGLFLLVFLAVTLKVFLEERGKRFIALLWAGMGLILTLAMLLPLIVAGPHFARLQNLERFASGQRLAEQEESLSGRADLARRGIGLAYRHPFFGVGLDQFRFYDQHYQFTHTERTYAHSNVIEVLADTGLVGFAVYHSAYLIILLRLVGTWKSCRLTKSSHYLYLCVLIGAIVILYDLFSVTYYTKTYWLALTMVLSSLTLAKSESDQEAASQRSGKFPSTTASELMPNAPSRV